MIQPSKFDNETYIKIRENVDLFLKKGAEKLDKEGYLLDIAPQIHEGASKYFKKIKIHTLDINPKSHVTYIGDITQFNSNIKNETYDIIVCTEVLEHTLNPFGAVEEMKRILKKGGIILASTPFNFRIHGPLPDCWRFTEYGLKELFSKFSKIEIKELKIHGRELMPLHYTVIATK